MPPRRPAVTMQEKDSADDEEEYTMKELFGLIKKLDKKMDTWKEEQEGLRADVDKSKLDINEMQQYLRNSSIRIYGLKTETSHTSSVIKLLQHVHDVILAPILQLAVDAGEIGRVPDAESLLEYGHVLPSRKAWQPPRSAPDTPPPPHPVLVRFHSRVYRSLVFRYKKSFLANLNAKAKSAHTYQHKVFLTEHLTAANYAKLRSLQEDEEVEKAWSMNGKLKFTRKLKPDLVCTVKDPFN